jgi:TolB-like protein/tetratricopeptide (TPR) repeat protein
MIGSPILAPDQVRAAVKRIQASAGLSGAPTLQKLLDYTVEATLSGRSDEIKETTLALEVFGRNSSFNPRADPIVRVQARKLRDRLAAWYERDGQTEEIVIEYTRGSYVPRFHARADRVVKKRSVAVLPFRNLSESDEIDYVCHGIAEELRYLLTRVHGVGVVAHASSSEVRNRTEDAQTIGAMLNADLLVRGTVRHSGPYVRVTAELIAVADGYLVWAERWQHRMGELFCLQDEIAAAVAGALESHVANHPARRVSTADFQAWQLYLKARFYWNQRTQHGFDRAVEHFRAALSRDPGFARAHASLADTYTLMAAHHLAPPAQCLRDARCHAIRAVEIDPALAAGHSALAATLLFYDRKPQEAEREWRRALELDANYAYAWHGFSVFGCFVWPHAVDPRNAIYEARRLEPLSAPIACDVGFTLYSTGRFHEAIQACHEAIDLHPSFSRTYVCLARSHAALGDYRSAIDACHKGRPLFTGRAFLGQLLATEAWACGHLGQTQRATELLRQLETDSVTHFVARFDLAVVRTGLGDTAGAIDLLQQAKEHREPWAVSIPVEPLLHPLRGHRRFCELTRGLFDDGVAAS